MISSLDVQVDWRGDEAIVTWCYEGGPPIVARCSVDYAAADPSVGLDAGYDVDGDVPDAVREVIAADALDRLRDRYEDAQERAAEYSRDGAW